MTIEEILLASEPMHVSGRFRKWLAFILKHYSKIDDSGNIIPEGISKNNDFKLLQFSISF